MSFCRLRFLLAISIAFTCLESQGQSELSLYRFGHSVPQAGMLNPSFIPDYKVVIGFPMLSQYAFVDNDELSFNDIFLKGENDSLVLDTLGLPAKLQRMRSERFETRTQLLLYGFRVARFYITLGANFNTQTRFSYPGNLIGWAILGPADTFYQGDNLALNDFSVDAVAYHEYYAGIARSVAGRFSLGGRVRYLIGVGSARSEKIDGSLHVGVDSISIHSSAVVLNTAGVSFFNKDSLGIRDYFDFGFKSKNKGLALDLGATLKVNDRITVSAAVNDLGYIKWKDYTRSYQIDPVDYSFAGFDVVDYLYNGGSTSVQDEIDSLQSLYKASEVDGGEFTTALIPKVYGAVTFQLGKRHELGLVAYTDINRGALNPVVGLSYSLKLGRMVQAVIGGSYSNGKLYNVGAGLSLKLGPLQVYATSDRANGILYPARTSWMNVRGGVNLVFGRVKEKQKTPADTTATEEADTVSVSPQPEPEVIEVVEDTVTKAAPPVDTIRAEQPAQQPVPDTTFIEQVQTETEPEVRPQEDGVTVKQGTHVDELPPGHYVIVGVFKSKANAVAYSERLKAANFYNTFGYVSARKAYYVQVYYSGDDLSYVRRVRDQFRKMNRFQFKDAWVLSVVE